MNPRVNKWLDLIDRVGWTSSGRVRRARRLPRDRRFHLGAGARHRRHSDAGCRAEGRDRPEHRYRQLGALIGQPVIEPDPK